MLQFIFPDTNSAKKTTLRNSLSITMTSKSRHASLRGTTGRPPSGLISFYKTPPSVPALFFGRSGCLPFAHSTKVALLGLPVCVWLSLFPLRSGVDGETLSRASLLPRASIPLETASREFSARVDRPEAVPHSHCNYSAICEGMTPVTLAFRS